MKFLIAPNALKGSLSAAQAAMLIHRALISSSSDTECMTCPIADGGNGTVECLVRSTRGTRKTSTVTGPLPSMKVDAHWGVLGDGKTAIIEMAECAGLHLLRPPEYDPLHSTTFGVGELFIKVLNAGFRSIIVGLGGSATNDGGEGLASALGVKFYDGDEHSLSHGGINLARLNRIDAMGVDPRISECTITVLSDVTNVLCGPGGTSYVFGKQKGASSNDIRALDAALRHYATMIKEQMNIDVNEISGSGAAGGLGAGLLTFCGAHIVSGTDFVLDMIHFNTLLENCDCVITAEGTIDEQTFFGKGIAGIARRAKQFGKPVHAFVGKIMGNPEEFKRRLGLTSIYQISPDILPLDAAISQAEILLEKSVSENANTLRLLTL